LDHLHTIVEGCMHHRPADQKCLYERYYGYCLKTVFRYIDRYDTAVDVVNDGFVKVFSHFSQFHFKPEQNVEMMLMGWMKTIMIHTAIDRLRKKNFLHEIGDLSENIWQLSDRSSASDNQLLYKELIVEIKKLPPGYRAVFNMYVIDGMTHQEISEALNISVGTSKSNLSKARGILQKKIKKNDEYISLCSL
jgi:RNA polymerase sigma factor (sigma-70 family)